MATMETIGRMRNKNEEGKKKNGDGGGRRCSDSPPIYILLHLPLHNI